MRVIAGLYDGTIHGWFGNLVVDDVESSVESDSDDDVTKKQDLVAGPGVDAESVELEFAYQAHHSCVKVLAMVKGSNGVFMASGGSDDLVRVYNVTKKREVGELTYHDNVVNCLAFAGPTHLLSGGEDGRICVWRAKDWECIHVLKGHKEGPVTSIAVRCCNTIALSTSRDNSLRMWDLTTGKPASRNKLERFKEIGQSCWSPDGSDYACVGDSKTLLVFSVHNTTGEPVVELKHPSRINSLLFLDESMLVTGADDGKLRVFGVDGSEIRTIDCSTVYKQSKSDRPIQVRVRSVSRVDGSTMEELEQQLEEDQAQIPYVVTGLSTGQVAVWDITRNVEKPLCVLRARSSAHLTCVVGDYFDPLPEDEQVESEEEKPESKSKKTKKNVNKTSKQEKSSKGSAAKTTTPNKKRTRDEDVESTKKKQKKMSKKDKPAKGKEAKPSSNSNKKNKTKSKK